VPSDSTFERLATCPKGNRTKELQDDTVFKKRGAQSLDVETGIRAEAYRLGERVLIVYQESEVAVVILIRSTSS